MNTKFLWFCVFGYSGFKLLRTIPEIQMVMINLNHTTDIFESFNHHKLENLQILNVIT